MSNAQPQNQRLLEEMTLEDTVQTSSDESSTASVNLGETNPTWQPHPINIRVSVPLIFGRWYFTLVGGPERRDPTRRAAERRDHPLFTLGNVIFFFIVGSLIGVAAAVLIINGAIQLINEPYTVITP